LDTGPARPEALEGIHLHEVATTADTRRGIEQVLSELEAAAAAGHVRTRDGLVTVDVLGRYRFEHQHMPARAWRHLRVTFRTVHSAKGLEADYVIVPSMSTGTFGFPSQIVDDPVLSLAMAQADPYPHAEERRLFYVALTRARRGVHLIAPAPPHPRSSPNCSPTASRTHTRTLGPRSSAPPANAGCCGPGTAGTDSSSAAPPSPRVGTPPQNCRAPRARSGEEQAGPRSATAGSSSVAPALPAQRRLLSPMLSPL